MTTSTSTSAISIFEGVLQGPFAKSSSSRSKKGCFTPTSLSSARKIPETNVFAKTRFFQGFAAPGCAARLKRQ